MESKEKVLPVDLLGGDSSAPTMDSSHPYTYEDNK